MNPQFLNIIRKQVQKSLGISDKPILSRYQSAKKARYQRKTVWRNINNLLLMAMGVLSAGFGLKGFLIPNNFIDGSVTGISLLINEKTNFPLS